MPVNLDQIPVWSAAGVILAFLVRSWLRMEAAWRQLLTDERDATADARREAAEAKEEAHAARAEAHRLRIEHQQCDQQIRALKDRMSALEAELRLAKGEA